MLATAEL